MFQAAFKTPLRKRTLGVLLLFQITRTASNLTTLRSAPEENRAHTPPDLIFRTNHRTPPDLANGAAAKYAPRRPRFFKSHRPLLISIAPVASSLNSNYVTQRSGCALLLSGFPGGTLKCRWEVRVSDAGRTCSSWIYSGAPWHRRNSYPKQSIKAP